MFNGYVYVATRSGIYRHSISDTSKLGAQELVLDLTKGVTSYLSIKSFSFSSDGSQMFIGSDSKYTILRVAVTSIPIPPSQVEVLYKGILPTNCKQFCFDTYIYAIIGNASPAVNWTIYKIDVGTTGAPYY